MMNIVNAVPITHPKIPLILGFIAKSGDADLKKLLMKTKIM